MSEQQLNPVLGPARTGTLVTADFERTVAAYVDSLGMQVISEDAVSPAQAAVWQAESLVGARQALLQSESGIAWIRVLEDSRVSKAPAFRQLGWMSLEVVVADVDTLATELVESDFECFRPPADLDVSDAIRAMQVIGPAGEVLYLTQVNGEVPPFDIPMASCRVDHLFIPVMCCHDRDASLAFYQGFSDVKGFSFDTKITSVNAAYDYPLDRKHPVATVQLAGSTMIEIDQIDEAVARPEPEQGLPAGIAMISYEIDDIANAPVQWLTPPQVLPQAPYNGRLVGCCRGAAGERVELIQR